MRGRVTSAATTPLNRFFRGGGRQDLQLTRARQGRQKACYRLPAGRFHHQEQDMLPGDERLGIDGDTVTGGG
jgi:hypothetical protein